MASTNNSLDSIHMQQSPKRKQSAISNIWWGVLYMLSRSFYELVIATAYVRTLVRAEIESTVWLESVAIISLALPVMILLAAGFLLFHKRWGLYLGIVALSLMLLIGMANLFSPGIYGLLPMFWILDALTVYYLYRWMTKHPQTTYFT